MNNLNYWGVYPVAHVSSNVNKPPYATMFLVHNKNEHQKHCCIQWFINSLLTVMLINHRTQQCFWCTIKTSTKNIVAYGGLLTLLYE
jgi:hypothetical protein